MGEVATLEQLSGPKAGERLALSQLGCAPFSSGVESPACILPGVKRFLGQTNVVRSGHRI